MDMQRWLRTPSPATAMSAAALFVSLSGVAYGAAKIGSAQINDNSIRSKDIRNRTLASQDISKATLDGLRRGGGPRGPAGPAGPAGKAGSALAYARVNADGTVDGSVSNGIALRSTGVGSYCLDHTGGGVRNAFVSPHDDRTYSGANSLIAAVTAVPAEITAAQCPAGTDVLVTTRVNNAFADLPFYIAIVA